MTVRRQLRRDARAARSTVRVIRKTFRDEARAIARTSGTTWGEALTSAIGAVDPARWVTALEQVYRTAALSGVWEETQTRLGGTGHDPETEVLGYAAAAIGVKARQICDTTIDELYQLKPPQKAETEGGLFRKAAAVLYRKFGKTRAARIAVTETLQAAATVQHVAARSSAAVLRVRVVKIWETVGDDRVRASHSDARGQQRDLDEPFTVGGWQLAHPRDPYGPPGEVINCRCWTTHLLVRSRTRAR